MKLGSKGKDVDTFVDQLKSEGEKIITSLSSNVNSESKSLTIKSDIDE